MTKGKLALLVLLGAVIGSGASYVKNESTSASQALESIDKSVFETCKFNDEIAAKLDVETEQRDCEKEYLD